MNSRFWLTDSGARGVAFAPVYPRQAIGSPRGRRRAERPLAALEASELRALAASSFSPPLAARDGRGGVP